MVKKIYKLIILPYTFFLLYLMFFGMGRYQYEDNIVRMQPVISTIWFIKGTISWFEIVKIVLGNIIMFVPFGFLGWFFPNLQDLKKLLIVFISAIVIVEALQYFSRLGVFDVDDIILNTFGVYLGFLINNFIERRFANWVV